MGLSCRLLIAGTMQQMALIAIPHPSLFLSSAPPPGPTPARPPAHFPASVASSESIFHPREIQKEKEFRKVAAGRDRRRAASEGGRRRLRMILINGNFRLQSSRRMSMSGESSRSPRCSGRIAGSDRCGGVVLRLPMLFCETWVVPLILR